MISRSGRSWRAESIVIVIIGKGCGSSTSSSAVFAMVSVRTRDNSHLHKIVIIFLPATSIFLLLVAMPFVPSSFFAPLPPRPCGFWTFLVIPSQGRLVNAGLTSRWGCET